MNQTVLLNISDHIGRINLNRPEAYNSVNAALASELLDALDECQINDDVRCIVLTGSGKAFCTGQDLKEVTGDNPPKFKDLLEQRYTPISLKLRQIEKPIFAAVNGVAAGAGANFALNCDIVVAHENASFIQAFSAIGLIPDSGGTFILPRLIGTAKATAISMLGDKISAKEAEEMGMIYKYFSAETFEEEVQKLATKLVNMPTKGLGLTKRAFNQSVRNSFEEQLSLEKKLQLEAASTEDYREGVTAFIEKRKPVFKGK